MLHRVFAEKRSPVTGGVRVRREAGSSSGKVDQDDLRRMRRHRTDTVGRSSQLTAWQRLQSESVDRHRTADTAAPAQHERITLSLGKLTGLRRESVRPPADRWSLGAHGPSSFAPERPPSTGLHGLSRKRIRIRSRYMFCLKSLVIGFSLKKCCICMTILA